MVYLTFKHNGHAWFSGNKPHFSFHLKAAPHLIFCFKLTKFNWVKKKKSSNSSCLILIHYGLKINFRAVKYCRKFHVVLPVLQLFNNKMTFSRSGCFLSILEDNRQREPWSLFLWKFFLLLLFYENAYNSYLHHCIRFYFSQKNKQTIFRSGFSKLPLVFTHWVKRHAFSIK